MKCKKDTYATIKEVIEQNRAFYLEFVSGRYASFFHNHVRTSPATSIDRAISHGWSRVNQSTTQWPTASFPVIVQDVWLDRDSYMQAAVAGL